VGKREKAKKAMERSKRRIEQPKPKPGPSMTMGTRPSKETVVLETCPDCGYSGGRHSRLCRLT
jgi:hypothetical protein